MNTRIRRHQSQKITIPFTFVVLLLGMVSLAQAASRSDVTWLPCGSIRVRPGDGVVRFNLPRDYAGVIDEPMVFLAIYHPPDVPAATQPAAFPDQALLKIKIGKKSLPDWLIRKSGTAYAINIASIHGNPKYADKQLELSLRGEMKEGEIYLWGLGAPDPTLLAPNVDGPLADCAKNAKDPDVRKYFEGLTEQFANHPEQARGIFRALRGAKDERISAYARRGLRLLKATMRSHSTISNFAQRYRWALFLHQCGFFSLAMEEFYSCSQLDGAHGTTWYRLGELAERCGFGLETITTFMERAGASTDVRDPTVWNVLVTILREREYEAQENGHTTRKTARITDDDVRRIKDQWVAVEKMAYGASRGTLRLNTAYFEIKNESKQKFTKHLGWLNGPTDDLVEERGWFDSVISIRPHLPGDRDETGGGDVGPRGAALSDMDANGDWQTFFRQWNNQLDWAMRVGECGRGFPLTADTVGCGHSPIPSEGYGLRAAMRYYMTSAMFRHAKVVPTLMPPTSQPASQPADRPAPTYLRYWRIGGPFNVEDKMPAQGEPKSHVLDSLPRMDFEKSRVIDSDADFIDLSALLGTHDWALARAACWINSPRLQHVQVWIGQNDRAALWVNGRCVHAGDYASAGKYEDQNIVDAVPSSATLEHGWNRVEVVVEGWPAPRNTGWGFSIRLATFDGKPITGLSYSVKQPESGLAPEFSLPKPGEWYRWAQVESAYHEVLPLLTAHDLESLTGLRGIEVRGEVTQADGMIALVVPGRKEDAIYRIPPATWDAKSRDVRLNNILDWSREDICAVRFRKDGVRRDLLVLKPEAFEAYLTLLKEPPQAKKIYGQRAPADRVLGYLSVPARNGSARTLIVADVLLSDDDHWPIDEEDLLDPE